MKKQESPGFSRGEQVNRLPLCETTDLPRVFCSCDNCDSFTMTATEQQLMRHRFDPRPPSPVPTPPAKRVVTLDHPNDPYGSPVDVKIRDGRGQCRVTLPPDPRLKQGERQCPNPTHEAFVCTRCAEQYEVDLGNVPALLADLELAITRRSRFAPVGPGAGNDLPYSKAASDAKDYLVNALVLGIRLLCEPIAKPVPALGSDAVAMSRWLLRYAASVPMRIQGPQITEELRARVSRAMSVIDRPPGREYIGLCQCGLSLWAPKGDDVKEATCTCGLAYDVQECRDALAYRARSALVTVAEMAEMGRIPINTIKAWVRRGRLQRRGETKDGAALYRYGEALDLQADTRRGA